MKPSCRDYSQNGKLKNARRDCCRWSVNVSPYALARWIKLSITQIPRSRKGDFKGFGTLVRKESDVCGAEEEILPIPSGIDVGNVIALRIFRLFYMRRLQVLID